METLTTEEQQVEALKRWWADNGKAVIVGLAIGLGAVFGWRAWVSYEHGEAEQSSALYQQVLHGLEAGDRAAVVQVSAQLMDAYERTAYAPLAALAQARADLESGDLKAADAQLDWVIQHGDREELKYVARLRRARVLVALDRGEEALQVLAADQPPASFASLYAELRGDLQLRLGHREDARKSYQKALASLSGDQGKRSETLQVKLDDLGTSPAAESVGGHR